MPVASAIDQFSVSEDATFVRTARLKLQPIANMRVLSDPGVSAETVAMPDGAPDFVGDVQLMVCVGGIEPPEPEPLPEPGPPPVVVFGTATQQALSETPTAGSPHTPLLQAVPLAKVFSTFWVSVPYSTTIVPVKLQ